MSTAPNSPPPAWKPAFWGVDVACYLNNPHAAAVQSRYHRAEGMAAFTPFPWAPCPAYDSDGLAELLHIGAGYYDHIRPGFEYCLDAPTCMPAGSMQAFVPQPYTD